MAHLRVGEALYDLDITNWPNVDVASAQRKLGCSSAKFQERIDDMDVDALQVLIWVLRRRQDPSLRVDQVTFTIREFLDKIELSDSDVRHAWEQADDDQLTAEVAKLTAEQQADRLSAKRADIINMLTDDQKVRLLDDAGMLLPEVAEAFPLGEDAVTNLSEISTS